MAKRILQNSSGGAASRQFSPPAFNLNSFNNTYRSSVFNYYTLPYVARELNLATVISSDPLIKFEGTTGCFSDGYHVYFVPSGQSCRLLARVPIGSLDTAKIEYLDMTTFVPAISSLNFFVGCTDGFYGYLFTTTGYVRVKLSDFITPDLYTCTYVDINTDFSITGVWTTGIAIKNYLYLAPDINCSKLLRQSLYSYSSTPEVLDLSLIDTDFKGFNGVCSDGKWIYLFGQDYTNWTHGKMVRVLLSDFSTVESINLKTYDPDLADHCGGLVCDGRYVYVVPNTGATGNKGKVTRIDSINFTLTGISVLDLLAYDITLKMFIGGCVHGRFLYLSPRYNGTADSGKMVRIDLSDFTISGIEVLDFENHSSNAIGYTGICKAGDFLYFAPNDHNSLAEIIYLDIPTTNGSY